MYSKFSENAQRVLQQMKKEMQELKHPYVGTEHLLLAILHNNEFNITKELLKLGLSYDKYRSEIVNVIGIGKKANDIFLYTPLLKRVIENCTLNCKDSQNLIDVDDLFISILEEGEGIANRLLLGMNIDVDYLYDKFVNHFGVKHRYCGKKLLLEEYAVNLNEKFKESSFDPVLGRDDQVNRVIEILLRRTKNNPVLVGEAGVGKTAIVEELVRKIELGNVPRKLLNVKVFSLSVASLIAGTKYRGEFEERINQIISEIENDSSVILFIDEVHTLVGAGGAEGAIDASNILKPYLARGVIRVIGATTKDEYSKYIEEDKALDRRFQKVPVLEMTAEDTENILYNIRDLYESYHGVLISDEIIKNVVRLTDRYIYGGKFPDKAIDLFDEVCAKTAITEDDYDLKLREVNLEIDMMRDKKNKLIVEHRFKEAASVRDKQLALEGELDKLYFDLSSVDLKKEVKLESLYKVIYDRTRIPVSSIIGFDKELIYNQLVDVVVGQDMAIRELVECVDSCTRRQKCMPVSMLFVGKNGVGKTFLAKEYAKMMGDKDSFVKLDMGEYSDEFSVSKIIGSPPGYVGYRESKSLADKVKNNPYLIILLDDIDKCCSKVLKLFSQVLEEGRLTDAIGEVVDFTHTTIFMTTNIGVNSQKIGFSRNDSYVLDSIKGCLSEEVVNKITKIIMFKELDKDVINKIVMSKIKNNKISTEIVDKIITESDYASCGARKLDNLIDSAISDLIEV